MGAGYFGIQRLVTWDILGFTDLQENIKHKSGESKRGQSNVAEIVRDEKAS